MAQSVHPNPSPPCLRLITPTCSSPSSSFSHSCFFSHSPLCCSFRLSGSLRKLNLPRSAVKFVVRCSEEPAGITLRTCKNCKTQFDPSINHSGACRFHTAHFGGETKRKFESVHSGGTLDTPNSGQVFQYWHCCGSEDQFDPGCTAAPHASYDD